MLELGEEYMLAQMWLHVTKRKINLQTSFLTRLGLSTMVPLKLHNAHGCRYKMYITAAIVVALSTFNQCVLTSGWERKQ